ncbi:MAG: hypothetical protein RIT28_3174 [Pseudomonadota bacterium]
MERLTAAAPAPEAPPAVEGAALVPVEITWEGVGPLHQSYFSDREAMTALSVALAPLLNGPVQLFIRYDNKTFQGQLRVRVPPGGFLRPPAESGRSIDLAALAPITTALASYRRAIASRFDVRVDGFAVGIELYRGPTSCVIGVGGAPPPDGRVVSPCVRVNGAEICGEPSASGVTFSEENLKKVADCLP